MQQNIYIMNGLTCKCERFISIPLCRQETEYTCGVACVQSILKCYGLEYTQDVLAEKMHTKPVLGTDYRDILHFIQEIGFQGNLFQYMNIEHLKSMIRKGITPVLLIQAWAEEGTSYVTDWSDSHYVIACGYDQDNIIVMDPYTLGNYTYIPANELIDRWHVADQYGCRYFNSGLLIKNESAPYIYDPCKVKYLG